MNADDLVTWQIIVSCGGMTITKVCRIFFCFGHRIDRETGPLELYSDGGVLLLRSGGGGEFLVAERSAWSDPFQRWSESDLATQLTTVGAHRRFELSQEFVRILGSPLDFISALENQWDRLIGVALGFGQLRVTLYCGADEEFVVLGDSHAALRRIGARPTVSWSGRFKAKDALD